MTRDEATKSLADGVADVMKDLVNNCRKNALSVGMDEAAAEFERGFDKLLEFEARATAIVSKKFPV